MNKKIFLFLSFVSFAFSNYINSNFKNGPYKFYDINQNVNYNNYVKNITGLDNFDRIRLQKLNLSETNPVVINKIKTDLKIYIDKKNQKMYNNFLNVINFKFNKIRNILMNKSIEQDFKLKMMKKEIQNIINQINNIKSKDIEQDYKIAVIKIKISTLLNLLNNPNINIQNPVVKKVYLNELLSLENLIKNKSLKNIVQQQISRTITNKDLTNNNILLNKKKTKENKTNLNNNLITKINNNSNSNNSNNNNNNNNNVLPGFIK